MVFITGEQVLLYVGVKTPTELETAWAGYVANAVNDGIAARLNGAVITDPPPPELIAAAAYAAGEAYKRREVPFGVTSYVDGSGEAVRLARDYLEGVRPVIDRYGNGPGIG